MARRLVRNKLTVAESHALAHISPSRELTIHMPSGGDIEVAWLYPLDDAERIVSELNIFLRGQRATRVVANTILPYLRYVISAQSVLSPRSLKDFRDVLDRRADIGPNTKASQFSTARRFMRHLMTASVLPQDDLPINLRWIARKPKNTFVDVCRYQLPELMAERMDDVAIAAKTLRINQNEALAFAFADSCMRAISSYAESRVEEVIQDWGVADQVIAETPSSEFGRIGKLSFRGSENKSVELALILLYVHFGRLLPRSQDWPEGIVDWCKCRGWPISRLRGALFPTAKTLDSFLVLILADRDLMPNVDSVAFYAYLDCCKPSHEKGFVDVHLGKKRGAPVTKSLRQDCATVRALQALAQKVKQLREQAPITEAVFSQEFVPVMLHCTASAGREIEVRALDVASPANMVRRVIRNASKQYPELLGLVGKATGENFRATHAYLRKLSGESDYRIKEALNHKNISTTTSYIGQLEAQASLNLRHQDFQRYLIREARVAESKRTGSGYVCGAETQTEKDCLSYSKCSGCEAKRIVFDVAAIAAEWIAWEREISSNKVRLQTCNPQRWASYWEPKLIEYQSLISLAQEKTLRTARGIAAQLVLPCLD